MRRSRRKQKSNEGSDSEVCKSAYYLQVMNLVEKRHITLLELQGRIKDALCDRFGVPVWVVAEIGEMKVNSRSGHCYMQLVEKGGVNGVPQAQASAVVWANQYGILSSYFSGATGEELKAGMKVLLAVQVIYHELYGLSLRIVDIDPLYTLGDLEQQRLKTIAQLREDGVFDFNRELDFPRIPQRIAVISSPNAAGYQDFIRELDSYIYRFDAELFEAVMQGHGAEDSIIDAMGRIACRLDDFDVVAIIRGGGSQSDLSFLNSYMLCFHIAQFPLPVVAGLGHDKDQSVVDMVAALSLKTPTAVAGFMVERLAEFYGSLLATCGEINNTARRIVINGEKDVQLLGSLLRERSVGVLDGLGVRLGALKGRLCRDAFKLLEVQKVKIVMTQSLLRDKTTTVITGCDGRIDHLDALLRAVDPCNILARGFAIVRSTGKALTDASQIKAGDNIEITLHKGIINATVDRDER